MSHCVASFELNVEVSKAVNSCDTEKLKKMKTNWLLIWYFKIKLKKQERVLFEKLHKGISFFIWKPWQPILWVISVIDKQIKSSNKLRTYWSLQDIEVSIPVVVAVDYKVHRWSCLAQSVVGYLLVYKRQAQRVEHLSFAGFHGVL